MNLRFDRIRIHKLSPEIDCVVACLISDSFLQWIHTIANQRCSYYSRLSEISVSLLFSFIEYLALTMPGFDIAAQMTIDL